MERDYKICFGEISFGELFGKNNVEGMTFKTKGGRSRRRGGGYRKLLFMQLSWPKIKKADKQVLNVVSEKRDFTGFNTGLPE